MHGIHVDFSCPVYHRYEFDELVTAPAEGYHVILSTSSIVDENRLLVQAGRVDVRTAVVMDDVFEHCTAAPDDADDGLLPPEPGHLLLAGLPRVRALPVPRRGGGHRRVVGARQAHGVLGQPCRARQGADRADVGAHGAQASAGPRPAARACRS